MLKINQQLQQQYNTLFGQAQKKFDLNSNQFQTFDKNQTDLTQLFKTLAES